MMKKAFYTAIFSDDKPIDNPIHFPKISGYDYLLFTNLDPSNFNTSWTIIQVAKIHLNSCLCAKDIKWNFNKYCPEYDISIWMDGYYFPAVRYASVYQRLIQMMLDKQLDLITTKHPKRNCAYDEIEAVLIEKKDSKMNTDKIWDVFVREGYPRNNGLIETTILIKNNRSARFNKICEELVLFMLDKSYRDQLAVNYIFWKHHFTNYILYSNNLRYIFFSACYTDHTYNQL